LVIKSILVCVEYDRRVSWLVVPATHDGVADASMRIADITGVTRDHMDMSVIDRLPCCGTLIQSYVEAIGTPILTKQIADPVNQLPKGVLLIGRALEVGGNMAAWNYQRVTGRNRIRVLKRHRETRLGDQDAIETAEYARHD
jgi:hypothetical protein